MASATKSEKRSRSGRFIKEGELNRRKSSAEKVRVACQQCSEGEKEAGQYDVESCDVGRWTKSRRGWDVSRGFGIVLFLSSTHTTEKCC